MCQNIFEKILITEPKNQVNFQSNLKITFREDDSYTHFKNRFLTDSLHCMGIILDKEIFFCVSLVVKVFIFGLLWTFITKWNKYCYKMRQLFHHKMQQKFITKCSRFFIIKRDNYYKMRLFYYKMRRTLQNVSVHCKTKGNWYLVASIFLFIYQNITHVDFNSFSVLRLALFKCHLCDTCDTS